MIYTSKLSGPSSVESSQIVIVILPSLDVVSSARNRLRRVVPDCGGDT